MKRALILTVIGVVCFLAGTAGIYLAMPSLSPDRVDSTRVLLDSLGLLQSADGTVAMDLAADSLVADTTDTTVVADLLPTPQDLIQQLEDSLAATHGIVQGLQTDTTVLARRLAALQVQLDELTARDFDATELSKSLAKLDDKLLGSILAGLELDTIERLYQKASARERTRLLESMSPEQAARFVRTLVQGPQPAAALENETPGAPTNMADQAASNP